MWPSKSLCHMYIIRMAKFLDKIYRNSKISILEILSYLQINVYCYPNSKQTLLVLYHLFQFHFDKVTNRMYHDVK